MPVSLKRALISNKSSSPTYRVWNYTKQKASSVAAPTFAADADPCWWRVTPHAATPPTAPVPTPNLVLGDVKVQGSGSAAAVGAAPAEVIERSFGEILADDAHYQPPAGVATAEATMMLGPLPLVTSVPLVSVLTRSSELCL